MKVLHFFKTAFPDSMGGIEQVIHQLARGTSKLGIKTDVLSLTSCLEPSIQEVDGYSVHYAYRNFQIASTGFSLSVFSRFSQLAKEADLIHYHFPWPFMDLVHFITRIKKPTILTYHSDIIRQKHLLKLYRPLKHCFLKDVDRIVATSQNYLSTSTVLKHYTNKVSVIPIGLDRASYSPAPSIRLQFWRERVGSKFYLFVGVLRYYKGLHILIEAAQGLDYPIVIVGAGPIENELKIQARALNIRNIHFLGCLNEEDKVCLLTLCYGVVFPSHLRSEAFGISLLEGAMFGKPMISSEIGTGTTFINIHQESGLVVPPSNSVALREAMITLWENPIQASMMGKAAQQRYWQHFTAEQMVLSYLELYNKILYR